MAAGPVPKQRVKVLDSEMAYTEAGAGAPIVFLHGNPTSSYLWRNVIPHVAGQRRCLAPDLIGMGDSGKAPAGRYRFADHARYLDAWFEALGLTESVILVGHDWGSALGFYRAHRFPDQIAGIAYMEAIVRPWAGWEEWPGDARKVFQGFRSEAGESLILRKNVFIERVLPGSILRKLGEEEMEEYRRPFRAPGEGRKPMLEWPRDIPIGGEPPDVAEIVDAYGSWLAESDLPKLFVNAEPGAILTGAQREFCRAWPNQTEVTVRGVHFVQEDSPDEIGGALAAFAAKVRG